MTIPVQKQYVMKPLLEKYGKALLNDPIRNKSTAFTREEREQLRLRGLLPYQVTNIRLQQQRVLENLHKKTSNIEKYIFLNNLLERNQRLFYRMLIDHIEEIMPLVYTPTVGEACREFAHIFRKPQGFYITPDDRGDIAAILNNWSEDDVRVIVVTDGERILGLGDLGANGMGIAIGKIALYVACAGIHPRYCLPVMLDVGTNNQALREDSLYLGYPHPRLTGEAYQSLVDEFIAAVQQIYPLALVQFEDFSSDHAFMLLDRYREHYRCFNDDIQGTAAVTLAGILAASRITNKPFIEQKIMLLGTGSAATGIAELILSALIDRGMPAETARSRLSFVDRKGLVTTGRDQIKPRIQPFAQSQPTVSFVEAIARIQPDVLIGATGTAGAFTEEVIHAMAQCQRQPVIIALSNPTSHTECTAEQAYRWSEGRAIFASGSPFSPVVIGEQRFYPAQGNNAYIFPGIGLGIMISGASHVTERMFLAAANTLAQMVLPEELSMGSIYPDLTRVRKVSQMIAANICQLVQGDALNVVELSDNLQAQMYEPGY